MRRVYELHGQGRSIRGIAQELGISRNTVRKYLRSETVPKQKARPRGESVLGPYVEHIEGRLAEGVFNCVVLLREIRELGYEGNYTVLKDYVAPRRQPKQGQATVRFETDPGEQAQVDFGTYHYQGSDGRVHRVFAFVMVLSWSRAMYVEFVARADMGSFLSCHWHGLSFFGGVPERCLYDNAKLVVLGRDAAGNCIHPTEFIDFALRAGFHPQLCRPYRAQTKGRVESGIKYVRGNFWPGARFRDLEDLNRQAQVWLATVANVRVHGTTGKRPQDELGLERPHLHALPAAARIEPYLWQTRKAGRDGFVRFQGASYGVPWQWAGKEVQVREHDNVVELWAGQERLALHPRATAKGQRFVLPGQWAGLSQAQSRPIKEPLALQLPSVTVQQRSLDSYEALLVAEGENDRPVAVQR